MVMAVVHGPETLVAGYGETTKGNGRQPDGKSLVRLGSISKVLAGEVLADMVANNQVALTAPIQDYSPPGIRIPTFGQRPITLLDLATHAAALLRELPVDPPKDTAPYAWPTHAVRFE